MNVLFTLGLVTANVFLACLLAAALLPFVFLNEIILKS